MKKVISLYKEAFSNHPREVWTLAIFTFINRVGTMVLPFLTVYLTTQLNYSLKQAGLLAGAFGVGSFFGAFTGGKLSDKIGARKVISWSLLLGGTFLFTIQFVTDFYPLLALIFLSAFTGEAYRPAVMAAAGNFVDKSQTARTVGLIRMAINLGFGAAPAIGGLIASSIGYAWLFRIDGGSCILAAIYFIFYTRNWKTHHEQRKADALNLDSQPSIAPFANQNYLLFLLLTLGVGFAFVQWFQSIPVFIKTEWKFNEAYIGMLMGTNGILIALIEMPIVNFIEKKNKSEYFVRLGLLLIASSFLFFLLPASAIIGFLAMAFLTFGEIFFLPFNSSQAMNMSPSARRGEYMAWYGMVWSLTHVIGPLVGLNFISTFGFDIFWLCLFSIVLFALLNRLLRAKRRKTEKFN